MTVVRSAKQCKAHQPQHHEPDPYPKVRAPRKNGPKPIRGPNGNKLKQVRYHQFQASVAIYHYQASFISFLNFRSLLTRKDHGYVKALRSDDPFAEKPVPAGDEVPAGCIEVGYLANVFQLGGSALGFRTGGGVMEWLCFDRDVKTVLLDTLDIDTSTARMLFDHVANLERAAFTSKWSRKLCYTEHKDWYEALSRAGRIPFRFSLAWSTFGTELKEEHLRRREASLGSTRTDAKVEHAKWREAARPDTIGRRTPVYYDTTPVQDFTPPQSSRSKRSRSSSSASVLSNRSTNMRREQLPLSTDMKSK